VHNIELKIARRSAGAFRRHYAQIVGRDQDYVIIRLNSGEQRLVHAAAAHHRRGVEPDHMNISIGKAVAIAGSVASPIPRVHEPVDHPHGAAKAAPRRPSPVTPWGKPTRARNPVEQVDQRFILLSRHKRRSKEHRTCSFSLERPFVEGSLLKKADAARASAVTT